MDQKEQRRAVWSAVHAFIRNRGGTVTSLPDLSPMVFQCSPGSKLPSEFERKHFPIRPLGEVETLGPITEMVSEYGKPASQKVARDHVGVTRMLAYEIDLPA